jgi:tRNA threonylcarbamoyladenosine biosynthesis protein TsaE
VSQTPPFPRVWELRSTSEAQTQRLGEAIGRSCAGGEIILLDGPLGAGKTLLANGIAHGLGIAGPLISPTYVILRSYAGGAGTCTGGAGGRPITLHHLDFYRLGGDEDLASVGLEDCFGEDTVIVAEWPGQCPGAFEAFTLALRLEPVDAPTSRQIRTYGGTLLPAGSALGDLERLRSLMADGA